MSSPGPETAALAPSIQRQLQVRFVCALRKLRGGDAARAWLDKHEAETGDVALRAEAKAQWEMGNRGRRAEWREPGDRG